MQLAKVILHAVDISNPARPFHICHFFSKEIQREFKWATQTGIIPCACCRTSQWPLEPWCRQQAEEEISLGLPVLPHMNLNTEELQLTAEMNFIDYICLPLWRKLPECNPGSPTENTYQYMYWLGCRLGHGVGFSWLHFDSFDSWKFRNWLGRGRNCCSGAYSVKIMRIPNQEQPSHLCLHERFTPIENEQARRPSPSIPRWWDRLRIGDTMAWFR